MRQQQAKPGFGRCAAQRGTRVAAVAGIEAVGTKVGHTGHDHHGAVRQRSHAGTSRSDGALMLQHPMFIEQHLDAHGTQFGNPGMHARVVLVVAGNEKAAVCGDQPGQGCHMGAQLVHRAVHQIAGDRDHVGVQCVDSLDDPLQIVMANRGPDMDVGDLHHSKAVQCLWQSGDGNVHTCHLRGLARIAQSPGGGQQRQQRHGGCAPDLQAIEWQQSALQVVDQVHDRQCQQQQTIAQDGQHKHRREETHAEHAAPIHGRSQKSHMTPASGQKRQGYQQC